MIRRLLHFTALGVIGLLAQGALAPRPRLAVTVGPGQSADQAVEEALLLAEAERLGWSRTDVVIRRHLAKVYGEATGQTDREPAALVEEARALGLDRTDRVVRGRLLDRARRALSEVDPPDDAALQAHRLAHPERFVAPPRYTVSLRYRSRARHGDAWPTVVAATAEAGSDPLPLAVRSPLTATASRLQARFGRAFALTVAAAPPHTWVGPVVVGDDAWFVRVDEVTPGEVPPLADIRAAVRADWAAEAGRAAAQRRLDRIARRWRVELHEGATP